MKYNYGQKQGWDGKHRYWVEQRNGCVAICDWSITKNLPIDLKKDTPGVIWFMQGNLCEDFCENCGHHHESYYVEQHKIDAAIKEADRLNDIEIAKKSLSHENS